MAQGKYARNSGSNSRALLLIVSLIFVITIIVLIVVMIGSGVFNRPEQPVQTEPQVVTEEPTQEVTQPVTEAPTEAPTEPETEAPTEEPTEAPTEAPTEPETEAPTEAPTETPTTPPPSDKGEAVAAVAKEQLGKPYLLGGDGPDAFDTTGFIRYCFEQNGINISRGLSEQASQGVEVPKEDLRPGDVLFFWTANEGEVEYPAIYIGNGMMIAARNSEHPVSEMSINAPYFVERFLFARRYY